MTTSEEWIARGNKHVAKTYGRYPLVAVRGEGVVPLRDWIERHAAHLAATGQREQRDFARATATLSHILRDELMAALLAHLPAGQMSEVAAAVAFLALPAAGYITGQCLAVDGGFSQFGF